MSEMQNIQNKMQFDEGYDAATRELANDILNLIDNASSSDDERDILYRIRQLCHTKLDSLA